MPSEQQIWYADSLKFTVTSRENVLTSLWTNKAAFGPVRNKCESSSTPPAAKLSAGKQAADIHRSHKAVAPQHRSASPRSCH